MPKKASPNKPMAHIPRLTDFNEYKKDLIKISKVNDEVVLFTKEEARSVIKTIISDELDLFAAHLSKERKVEIEDRMTFKLKQLELAMVKHVDDKINKITEKIIDLITSRKIEEEVQRRVEEKLKKIRSLL